MRAIRVSACLAGVAAVLTAWQPPLTDVVAAAVPAHSTHGRLGPVHPWSNRNHKRVSRITAGDPAQFGSPTTLSTICCMNGYDTVAPQEFTVADVNRDGIPDLISANVSGNSAQAGVVVALGRGDGSFQPATVYVTPSGVFTVDVGDVNGDGYPDVVAAERDNGRIDILLGNGSGAFGPPSGIVDSSIGRSVRLADVNGDGKLDVINAPYTVGNNFYAAVWLGNGDGTFASTR